MSGADRCTSADTILEVRELGVTFPSKIRQRSFVAVNDVSFTIRANETVGLVGESGSGKTTIARAVLGMIPASRGSIIMNGRDVTRATKRERRALSHEIQVVFQDPYSSLSPTRTIWQTLAEPVLAQSTLSVPEALVRAGELLERVGLDRNALVKFPRQFSGGQRQRIAIARALMLRPRLVVLDEPVSALDLSVQAQVLNLLRELQRDYGLSYLFIAHNLAVVRYMATKVMVLYRGHLMESGSAETVYRDPGSPYTKVLLDAAPVADPEAQALGRPTIVRASVASSDGALEGCVFRSRCAYAVAKCASREPPLISLSNGSEVSCFRGGSYLQEAQESGTVGALVEGGACGGRWDGNDKTT